MLYWTLSRNPTSPRPPTPDNLIPTPLTHTPQNRAPLSAWAASEARWGPLALPRPHLWVDQPAVVQRHTQQVEDTALGCVLKIRDARESHVDVQTCGQFGQHRHCVVHVLGVETKRVDTANRHPARLNVHRVLGQGRLENAGGAKRKDGESRLPPSTPLPPPGSEKLIWILFFPGSLTSLLYLILMTYFRGHSYTLLFCRKKKNHSSRNCLEKQQKSFSY